jgi:hypothetical protein
MMRRLVVLGVGAVGLVVLLLLVTVLAIYRPSIEFAYVDVIDVRPGGGPEWWVMGMWAVAVLASIAALVRLWRKRRVTK